MLTLDEVRTTEELAALLGLHAEWCPAGGHLRTAAGCRNEACHRAQCHDMEHSYRRYSANSEYGHYTLRTQPIPEGLIPYADLPVTGGANGAHRLVTGQRWVGERYAQVSPAAEWLITLRAPDDRDTRHIGLCDAHWQERLAAGEAEWIKEIRRIQSGALSLAAQVARDVGDWRTFAQLEAQDSTWLARSAGRYHSLLDLAERHGSLRVIGIVGFG